MSTDTADNPQNDESHQGPANDQNKITVLFKAVGNTPVLAKRKLYIDRSETVASLVNYLRKKLRMRVDENIFIFVASSFTPALDTDIGTIFDCFSAEGTLFLQYCTTTAWG